ncbi:DJ-1/PfpI family protein [Lacipirellula sp.]|uniref:DJ-1/PfpI family protein n=1 Tax=Lacipirellula sp. TaxID=2691419 RepID=UPI003D0F5201
MSAKRLLMLVGDFVEDYEAIFPYQAMQMAGHHIDTASPGKESGSTVVTAIHDFEGFQTYTEKRGHNFPITIDWGLVDESTYDGLIIPGGRSPEFLQLDERVLEIVRKFFADDKPVASTCHGGLILAAAEVVEGRRCQAYPSCWRELAWAGAIWEEPTAGYDGVTVDGNLVTAAAWPGNPAWMREFLKLLK